MLTIWNRDFPIPLCSVQRQACRGCGVCEELCPLAIPRVTAQRTGTFIAQISAQTCIGCGICAGACPTGAIVQQTFDRQHLEGGSLPGWDLKGLGVVYACSRSPLPEPTAGLIKVPCVGRVTIEDMLGCLARGADGILLMCRDRASCPYERGGHDGERRASVAEELAAAAGLGRRRIQYLKPPTGLEGPARALSDWRAQLPTTRLQGAIDQTPGGLALTASGLDRALEIISWLKERPELEAALPPSLQELFPLTAASSETVIWLGDLPELDLLLSLLIPNWRLRDLIEDARELLRQEGLAARALTTSRELSRLARQDGPVRVIVFDRSMLPELGSQRSAKDDLQIVTLDELAGCPDSAEGRGFWPAPPTDQNFRFRMSPEERVQFVSALRTAGSAARFASPYLLAQIRLLLRKGAWQGILPGEPTMAFTAAARAGSGS
jgi:ferredoxin